MHKSISRFLLVVMMSLGIIAHGATIPDSLKKVLAADKHDSVRALHLYILADQVRSINLDIAKEYVGMGFELSSKINFPRGIAKGYFEKGTNDQFAGNYSNALYNITCAARIFDSIHSLADLGTANMKLAEIMSEQKNYVQALKYAQTLPAIFIAAKDTYDLIGSHTSISNIYQDMGQYDSCLAILNRGLALCKKQKEPLPEMMSVILGSIGNTYFLKRDYKKSIEYIHEAMKYIEKSGNDVYLGNAYSGLAENEIALGRLDEAEKDAKMGLAINRKVKVRNGIRAFYEQLARIYEAKKEYRKSTEWYKNLYLLNDSLFNEQSLEQTSEMNAKYESEKKDKALGEKNAELERQKLVTYASLAIIVMVILIAIVFYINLRKINRLSKTLESQKNELNEINTVKDRLFSIISHDLRGPMLSLGAAMEMIMDEDLTREKMKEYAYHVKASSDNTLELLDNLLNWSSTQMKGMQFSLVRVDVCQLIAENVHLCESAAGRKGINIHIDCVSGIVAMADMNVMKLVIRNLMGNAIKFTPYGGNIYVAASVNDSTVKITVQDTGVGIPAELLDNIFELNNEKIRSGTAKERGSGLGLNLCYELLKESNGNISAESIPGKGSTFKVIVPRAG